MLHSEVPRKGFRRLSVFGRLARSVLLELIWVPPVQPTDGVRAAALSHYFIR